MKQFITIMLILVPINAWATSTGMPWEGPMNQILNSLTGPWLRFGSVVAIMSAGLALALGETSGFLKKMIMLVLGLSIACAASGWGLSFFGFAGGFCF
ncbi:Conjugal transfer,TrbC [Candidatus Magnetomorum sp. HK-1]|nr:Conjugal transfer,TrbC [Candidatus Magnetomorum sp. HK-1]